MSAPNERAIAAAKKVPTNLGNNYAFALWEIAKAQSEIGDVKAFQQTVESIPKQSREFKASVLVEQALRAKDFKQALEIAAKETEGGASWALARIALAQAKASDFKAGQQTRGQIKDPFTRISVSASLALELAKAGQKEPAVKMLQEAIPAPEIVGADEGYADDIRSSLQDLARAQAELGDENGCLKWIAKLPSPFTRTYVLLGVVEGIAAREGNGARPRLYYVPFETPD